MVIDLVNVVKMKSNKPEQARKASISAKSNQEKALLLLLLMGSGFRMVCGARWTVVKLLLYSVLSYGKQHFDSLCVSRSDVCPECARGVGG